MGGNNNMMNNTRWESIFSVIQQSYSIETHLDFFTWLQSGVNELLPHDVLLSCWGGFEKNHENKPGNSKLNYDVASNLSSISTQSILNNTEEMNVYLLNLHKLWLDNNRCWFVINNLDQLEPGSVIKGSFPSNFKQLKSLVVYGVSDIRGSNECLYVFFSKEKVFNVPDLVMGMVMPHIDSVLRKIKHLQSIDAKHASTVNSNAAVLSERELEVIHWIKSGKTNQEIGVILAISQNTVKSHVKRVFQKLNVTKRAQAIALLSN